ncbi:hypothetical protein EVAR_16325_1 [Eumeta japonica]|uniref:Uncharacterized protein n=1 Tax=Eumeta variegata TaxID=151549 RepID=A0A4C1VFP6_EUMVA|nr:hypothetical protein EVAR_16325_1 [Eumeta japonica]
MSKNRSDVPFINLELVESAKSRQLARKKSAVSSAKSVGRSVQFILLLLRSPKRMTAFTRARTAIKSLQSIFFLGGRSAKSGEEKHLMALLLIPSRPGAFLVLRRVDFRPIELRRPGSKNLSSTEAVQSRQLCYFFTSVPGRAITGAAIGRP